MGLFQKIKNMFSSDEKKEEKIEIEKEKIEEEISDTEELVVEEKADNNVKVYEKGLTKSRQGFVSRLANLTNKYHKVT